MKLDKYVKQNLPKVDKVYYISKCQLKPANKQFSTLKNDYEMTMTSETIIQECEDDDSKIPEVQYNFVQIEQLANMEPNALVGKLFHSYVIKICHSSYFKKEISNINGNRSFR